MKKLLVLNGSHSDVPLIEAGKKLGYYVITSGNAPDLVGHKYADEYVNCDFSDYEKMYSIVKDMNIDAVCSCANDFGAITAAYLAEKLGLPGHDSFETALLLHQKNRFKAFAAEHNVLTPAALSYVDEASALADKDRWKFPVMVKPIDRTGGKGVMKADADMYEKAVKHAFSYSFEKRIVIEEFIEGTLHSFSSFLIDKKVAAYYSDNEYTHFNPFLVSTSGGPALYADRIKDILIPEYEKIAKALDLKDGIFHSQYIMSPDNEPHIIDITRRCSGDIYPEPVEHSTGIPWAEWIVRSECGMSCDDFPKGDIRQKKLCGRHCIMGEKEGIVKEVCISDEIKGNIHDSFMWGGKGYEIRDRMSDKVGILFLEYGSEAEMLDKCARIKDLVRIVYED